MRSMMNVACAITFGAFLAGVVSAQAAPAPKSAESFERDLKSLTQAASRGEWKNLKPKLAKLLVDHDKASYVFPRKEQIETLFRNATFREKTPAPDPKKLVSGNLVVWEPGSGRIKIEYVPGKMGDWIEEGAVHPAAYAGPHSVEVKLRAYPQTTDDAEVPSITVDGGTDVAYSASFGLAYRVVGDHAIFAKPKLLRIEGEKAVEAVVLEEHAAVPLKPCTLKLATTESKVTAYVDGKAIMATARKKGPFGYVVVGGMGPFEKITIEGKVEPSWIQGLVDQADSAARQAFEAGYDAAAAGFPAWLAGGDAPSTSAAKDAPGDDALNDWPDDLDMEVHKRALSSFKMSAKDRLAELLKPEGGGLPPATRLTLLAEARRDLDQFDQALVDFDAALKEKPGSLRSSFGRGQALSDLGRFEDAIVVFKDAVTRAPASSRAAEALSSALLSAGRLPDAHRAATDALARGAASNDLRTFAAMIAKAAHGPEWIKRETVVTDHYEIVSDLDRNTCVEAGRVLEDSYTSFGRILGKLKVRGGAKARVFLFSGKAGYERYATDVLGDPASHTAGLYAPGIKQLLIWNIDTREMMMRTVRHEGFHQYCDRMWRDPPLWLNEGLAEYFETVRVVNGSWSTGEIRKDHLPILAAPMRLSEFFNQTDAAFYAKPERSYGQAWALTHFLLHGGPAQKKLFDKLKAALDAGASADRALSDVFTPEVLPEFEAEFRGHLAKIRS